MSADAQRFSVLALLYLVTNARIGSGDNRRRVQRVMTRPEREAVTAVLERLPATVAAWSDGLATLEPMHIVEVRRPLSSLSSSGGGRWWAGPRDCREELAELTADRPYDSVIVLWPSAPDLTLCGWGCTVDPSDATFGAGFSSIASDHWPTLATDRDPEQGYVHEWLHQVEAIYRGLGLGEGELPGLHAAADFTSQRPADEPPFGRSFADFHDGGEGRPPARTWAPWYRDWMTGRLRPLEAVAADGPPLGLTPERWALRDRVTNR
ncbi:MAG TPA: hypothetical protein VFW02_07645 [Candidatus Limnocylindrales bacterium]|nr:hypothetical protein [Candidatus Limnocylindrales bacterium]